MQDDRTPEWWLVRVELVAGISLTALIGLLGLVSIQMDCFGCDYQEVVGLPSDVVFATASFGVAVAGLISMLRIARGPTDEPPPWRYRDH